ncbi:histidine kinase [Macrococcoides bohemicum]|uniref:histidine kinase n=1 Tax=Macrococcoides bohemicum TaxID=1903056 RepID=A0AAE7U8M4_9STAP|nr:histidine kinase [Macrococcus bohemicus]QRN49094.1 histidine kinase [Macrococcus bohemicus]QYA42859.1 histidine kinase [Macrococcus bohemicus]
MNHSLFKRKLRRTIILSAILPVFLLTMIGLLAYYAIYIMKTGYELEQTNKKMIEVINKDEPLLKKRFDAFIKEIPESSIEINRNLYRKSIVGNQNYLFYLDYKEHYTNNYTAKPSIPLYHRQETYKQVPYELEVSLPIESISKFIDQNNFDYVITDCYDNIYYSSAHHTTGKKYLYDEQMQITSLNQQKNLKVYVYQDLTETINKGLILIAVLFITFILLILITLFSSKLLAKRQTKDIDEIIARIRQAQVRALTSYQPLTAPSELEIINRYVFELSQFNERLLKSTKDSNEALRQSQLKSLENQFQPHFIFNTMQTINYMIDTDKKAAKKMMIKLSSILRYALRVKESEVTFKKEIEYLEDYLFIQNIRFDQAIQYTIDIEASLENVQTDKLLIQPLIENAIKYGAIEDGLSIKVRIKQLLNGDIFIAVYDDGKGMTKERLKEVRSMIQHYKLRNLHIGMQNIHQTLRVKYGKHYGMKVYSVYNNGTLITLRVKKGGTYV